MKHNSSALFYFKYYILCTKRTNQSKRFENFECSGQNFHNFCHFWNNKSVFLWILRQSSELQDKSSILFSWNFIHFQQKETITSNYKFGENFMWAVKSLKFCILMGSKNWLLVSNMTWRVWWIFPQPLKSLKICFRWVLFVQSKKVWATKIQKSYLSLHWTVMKNLNELVVSKMAWGIGWMFITVLKSLKNCVLMMGSFCLNYTLFQLENFIGIMCHDTEGWCKI